MKALTYQGERSVSVEDVPDPVIQQPTDAIVRITSTAICGSDLHLYELFDPFLDQGDILGHESMGIVEEVGTAVTSLSGVYGGEADPLPMKSMFDKNITLRMGQCNVRNWIDDLVVLKP